MYKRLAVAMFAVLAIAVVAAGCGGGGSSSSSGTSGDTTGGSTESSGSEAGGPAPTKAVFIKEADAICEKADAMLSEEVTEYAKQNNIPISEKEPSEDQQIQILENVVFPNITKQGEDLETLTPPAGEEETVEDITSTLADEVQEAEENPGDLNEDSLSGATKKAQAYGLKTCGS